MTVKPQQTNCLEFLWFHWSTSRPYWTYHNLQLFRMQSSCLFVVVFSLVKQTIVTVSGNTYAVLFILRKGYVEWRRRRHVVRGLYQSTQQSQSTRRSPPKPNRRRTTKRCSRPRTYCLKLSSYQQVTWWLHPAFAKPRSSLQRFQFRGSGVEVTHFSRYLDEAVRLPLSE